MSFCFTKTLARGRPLDPLKGGEGQHEEERRALGQRVRIAAELRLGATELRELNRIGVNLNQMARALNSGSVSSPVETQAAVERVGELVAKLLAGERE